MKLTSREKAAHDCAKELRDAYETGGGSLFASLHEAFLAGAVWQRDCGPDTHDWFASLGNLSNDAVTEEIAAAGRAWRERQTR